MEGCERPGGDDAHGGRLAFALGGHPPPELAPSQEAPHQRLLQSHILRLFITYNKICNCALISTS